MIVCCLGQDDLIYPEKQKKTGKSENPEKRRDIEFCGFAIFSVPK